MYNFAGVLNFNLFVTLAARLTTSGGSSRGQYPPSTFAAIVTPEVLLPRPSTPASEVVSCFSLDTKPRMEC
jgi:hypothetical protein